MQEPELRPPPGKERALGRLVWSGEMPPTEKTLTPTISLVHAHSKPRPAMEDSNVKANLSGSVSATVAPRSR